MNLGRNELRPYRNALPGRGAIHCARRGLRPCVRRDLGCRPYGLPPAGHSTTSSVPSSRRRIVLLPPLANACTGDSVTLPLASTDRFTARQSGSDGVPVELLTL